MPPVSPSLAFWLRHWLRANLLSPKRGQHQAHKRLPQLAPRATRCSARLEQSIFYKHLGWQGYKAPAQRQWPGMPFPNRSPLAPLDYKSEIEVTGGPESQDVLCRESTTLRTPCEGRECQTPEAYERVTRFSYRPELSTDDAVRAAVESFSAAHADARQYAGDSRALECRPSPGLAKLACATLTYTAADGKHRRVDLEAATAKDWLVESLRTSPTVQ